MGLTVNQTSTLVQVLAVTDALFAPFRRYGRASTSTATAISERREAFPNRGVPLVVSGGGTERLAGERELLKLEADGLLRIYRAGKRIGVALTDHGDDYVRTLTAGYRADESWSWLKRIAQYRGHRNAGHVLEVDLLQTSYDRVTSPDLVGLENELLPLLAHGWLTSESDAEGRIGYSITDAGRKAMRTRRSPGELPEYDAAAGDEYDKLHRAALADRDSWVPLVPSLVAVPLSAGNW